MDKPTDLLKAEGSDPQIVALLRDFYAPPAEGPYWDALENRIMASIGEHNNTVLIPVNWWTDLAAWAAPGLAAAALVFVASGLLLSRQKDEDLRATYDEVTEPVTSADYLPGAVQVVVAPHDGSSQREATFRYVLSH